MAAIEPIKSLCSIEGCERPVKARGWCWAHLRRFYRSGNPLGSGIATRGEVHVWVRNHVDFAGPDCLIWPFQRSDGYAAIRVNGKKIGAHRYMCELAHGAPPFYRAEAAHSCGRGHLGCVNPRHLRWATQSQNCADRIIHGTAFRGSAHPWAKLREEQIPLIRKDPRPPKEIAKTYGVSDDHIRCIKKGQKWGWCV